MAESLWNRLDGDAPLVVVSIAVAIRVSTAGVEARSLSFKFYTGGMLLFFGFALISAGMSIALTTFIELMR